MIIRRTDDWPAEPTRLRSDRPLASAAEPAAEPVLGMPVDRIEQMLPADLIQDGSEIVILLLKPSPWYIVLACLGHLAFIIGLTALLYSLNLINEQSAFIFGAALLLARLTWQYLDWLGQVYVLTDRRVIRRMGVLRTWVFEAPLKNVQHTYIFQSIRERALGLGTIAFATAGTSAPEAYWLMVNQPNAVHRRVVSAISRYGGRHGG